MTPPLHVVRLVLAVCMACVAVLIAPRSPAASSEPPQFDIVIHGAHVLDGTGRRAFRADVAVANARIVAVGRLPSRATSKRTLDARGLLLAPGFIDAHSHAWPAIGDPRLAASEALLNQGITTALINPDGSGPIDLVEQRRHIEAAGPAVNVAPFIGHNSVRIRVLGYANRSPSAAELEQMRQLVRTGMQAGAFGLSAGPFYTPGNFSKTDEHVALARVAAEYGGVYSSHIRDESRYSIGLLAAVDELVQVARQARLPAIITHIKASTPECWGLSADVIRKVNGARAEGLQVFADQYPYDASSTDLAALLLPPVAQEGGSGALVARLSDAQQLAWIRPAVAAALARRGGPNRIQISAYGPDRSFDGQRLGAVAAKLQLDPVDAALAIMRGGNATVISYTMSERDIRAFMREPWTMTSTDGELPMSDDGAPHPRVYGTFPRKLRRYVLDERIISLERAVQSMTGLPAEVFGLRDRGQLRVGAWADLVVLDPATIRDHATYENPRQLSSGIRYLLVNGELAIAEGIVTPVRAGRVLSRTESSESKAP